MLSIIDSPTNIKIGAIADIGIQDTIGARNIDNPKHRAVEMAVRPVLPPDSIPTLLSTKVLMLLVPNKEPIIVADESQIKAFSNFGGRFPWESILKIPAFFPVPMKVPMVSNRSDITRVKMVITTVMTPDLAFNNPVKSNLKRVGSIDGNILYWVKSGSFVTPKYKPMMVVRIIDIRYEFFTFFDTNIPVITRPISDSNTSFVLNGDSCGTTSLALAIPWFIAVIENSIRPALFRPIYVMNKPIPTVMACCINSGIDFIIFFLRLVIVIKMLIRPQINTIASPCCQVNPIVPQIV